MLSMRGPTEALDKSKEPLGIKINYVDDPQIRPFSLSISPIGQFTLSEHLAIDYGLESCVGPFTLITTSIG